MPRRLMVGQSALNRLIVVRIHAGQHNPNVSWFESPLKGDPRHAGQHNPNVLWFKSPLKGDPRHAGQQIFLVEFVYEYQKSS